MMTTTNATAACQMPLADALHAVSATMLRCELYAGRGALVAVRDVRSGLQARGWTVNGVDAALWRLIKAGLLSAHRHDYATSLTAAERAQMLDTHSSDHADHANTRYICGVSIRQS